MRYGKLVVVVVLLLLRSRVLWDLKNRFVRVEVSLFIVIRKFRFSYNSTFRPEKVFSSSVNDIFPPIYRKILPSLNNLGVI